jgi:hypothetical protein
MFDRLRKLTNYAYFRFKTRKVYQTPPTPCDPSAGCELHTMLSAQDVPLYLLAVKSLLRFHPALAVVVHSDGTLGEAHELLLRRHVPGCRFIPADKAHDLAARSLGTDSFLFRCRGFDVHYRRLIDTGLWSVTGKRIIMDADVLVVQEPREVIEWVERGSGPFLMGQDPPRSAPLAPPGPGAHVQYVFKYRLKELAESLGWPAKFQAGATAGFYGCTGEELELGKVERLVRACLDMGMPLHHWGSDQCMVVYLLSIAEPRHLSPEHYFNYLPAFADKVAGAHLVHFIGSFRFDRNLYTRRAAEVVRQLMSSEPALSPA